MANVSLQGILPSAKGDYIRLEGRNWVCDAQNKNNKKISSHGRIFTACGKCSEIHADTNYMNKPVYLMVERARKCISIIVHKDTIHMDRRIVPLNDIYLDNHWFKYERQMNPTTKNAISSVTNRYFTALSDARKQYKQQLQTKVQPKQGQQTASQVTRTTDRAAEQEKKQEVDLKAKVEEERKQLKSESQAIQTTYCAIPELEVDCEEEEKETKELAEAVTVHQETNRIFNDQHVHAVPKEDDADLIQLLSELNEVRQEQNQRQSYNTLNLNGTTYNYPENNRSFEIDLQPLDTAQESTGMFRIGVKQRLIIDT